LPQSELVHALEGGQLAVQRGRSGAVLQAQALVPLDRGRGDVDGLRPAEYIREFGQADLLQVREALAPVVTVLVDDQVLEVVECDLVREDDLAVQRIGDALLEELDPVGTFPVCRRLADRAPADDVLDVPFRPSGRVEA
jgi:hypothetical protein